MKKIAKGYWIVSALLLLWAAADFYHYAQVGKDLISHYQGAGIIQWLVHSTLFHGIVKLLLAVLVMGIGLWRSKAKKRVRSITAVTGLLLFSILGTWLVSMTCLTIVTAQEIYDQLYELSYDFPDVVSRSGRLDEFYDTGAASYGQQYERPDYLEYMMLEAISSHTEGAYRSGGYYNRETGREKLIRDIGYPLETAVLFYDGEGNLLHSSREDILFFNYFTQAEWDAGADASYSRHWGWMDISQGKGAADPEGDPWRLIRDLYNVRELKTLRVTGVFAGNELKPVTVHYVTAGQVQQAVESTDQFSTGPDSHAYIVSDVDRAGLLDWQLLFDRSSEHPGEPLVTVYLESLETWDYAAKALTYDGAEYESLAALTETLDFPARARIFLDSSELREAGIFSLHELLVFGGWTYADYEGFDYSAGGEPETEFMLVTAIRSRPLSCAMDALRSIYIWTGLLALVLVLLVRYFLKKRLVQPIADAAAAMSEGWEGLNWAYRAETPRWREAELLEAQLAAEQDWRRMKMNEITRLNTALDYAKTAEENRRQMTSNIAHELKTPLAVVHSYAEGLKEHIAEDSREQYLDVILSETERMDAMVLEMLDLSRLEAGKVKLARDEFSLTALARQVFDKLSLAAQAKNLHVKFDCPADCKVTADEARMGQVVENFAANAVKYTPPGGTIIVRVRPEGAGAFFSVENDSPPLSPEALSKVWDSFYRADEARTAGGTGLGLAIARSIIALHGGSCAVRNTKTGVEFSFRI